MSIQNILDPLKDVEGYIATAMFDVYGEVLLYHNESKYNIDAIGLNVIELLHKAIKTLINSGLGKCAFIQLNDYGLKSIG